jgi:hypothetical protein
MENQNMRKMGGCRLSTSTCRQAGQAAIELFILYSTITFLVKVSVRFA